MSGLSSSSCVLSCFIHLSVFPLLLLLFLVCLFLAVFAQVFFRPASPALQPFLQEMLHLLFDVNLVGLASAVWLWNWRTGAGRKWKTKSVKCFGSMNQQLVNSETEAHKTDVHQAVCFLFRTCVKTANQQGFLVWQRRGGLHRAAPSPCPWEVQPAWSFILTQASFAALEGLA